MPGIRSSAALALTLWAVQGFAVQLYLDRIPTQTELEKLHTGAKFEPTQGCLLGAYVDLDSKITETYKDRTGIQRRLPDEFEAKTGRQHASYFFYMGYGRQAPVDWIVMLGMQNRIVHIALEPNIGLQYVLDNKYLKDLATSLADTKTPILLRFASEMNGDWLAWNGKPEEYKEKFRLVAKTMRKYAPNVAMVWCPYASPTGNIKDYYPGDDVVDWVGVNIYNVTYFNQNHRTPAKNVGPTELLDPVYRWYSDRKPIMIGEYGATHFSKLENLSQPQFAIGCLSALYSALPRKYPKVKLINYFNTNNLELDHAQNNNYAVTDNPLVLSEYRSLISSPWFLDTFPSKEPPLQPQPMPINAGDVVSGVAKISGWAPIHTGVVKLRLRANGKVVHEAPDVSSWTAELDTTAYPDGPLTLSAEVVKGGKVTSRDQVRVVVDNE